MTPADPALAELVAEVEELLAASPAGACELGRALWECQQRRRVDGGAVGIETCLRAATTIRSAELAAADEGELIVDLVYGEFVLREQCGEAPAVGDYTARFPQCASQIERQLSLHLRLADTATNPPDARYQETTVLTESTDEAAAARDELPMRIGDYLAVELLAAADGATLFRGVSTATNGEVYIKLMQLSGSVAELPIASAQVGNSSLVNSPHAVEILGRGAIGDRQYLVTRPFAGESLRQRVQRERPSRVEAARWAAGLARAVDAARRDGLQPTSLSPDRIIVAESGLPVLADFVPVEFADAAAARNVARLQSLHRFLLSGRDDVGVDCPEGVTITRFAADLERLVGRSRWKLLASTAVTAVMVIAAVVFGGRWLRSRGSSDGEPPHEPPAKPASVVAWDGEPTLEVRVGRRGRFFDLVDTVPLPTGTGVYAQFELPAKYHAAVFRVDPAGRVESLAEFAAAKTARQIRVPQANGTLYSLAGAEGTELLLLCGRQSQPVTAADVQASIDAAVPLPKLAGESVLRIDRKQVIVEQSGRAFGRAETGPADPQGEVLSRLQQLRLGLSKRFGLIEALSFRHVE